MPPEHHWNWKGGITTARDPDGPDFVAWRTAAFARDACRCQTCGDAQGGNLEAHHVRPWATHPELRFDVTNGLTLCDPCHNRLHRTRT